MHPLLYHYILLLYNINEEIIEEYNLMQKTMNTYQTFSFLKSSNCFINTSLNEPNKNTLCNICSLNGFVSESQLTTNSCKRENYENIVSKAQMLFLLSFSSSEYAVREKKIKEINIKESSTVVCRLCAT